MDSFYLDKENYIKLEEVIKKIASKNDIKNVEKVNIVLSKDNGIIKFSMDEEKPMQETKDLDEDPILESQGDTEDYYYWKNLSAVNDISEAVDYVTGKNFLKRATSYINVAEHFSNFSDNFKSEEGILQFQKLLFDKGYRYYQIVDDYIMYGKDDKDFKDFGFKNIYVFNNEKEKPPFTTDIKEVSSKEFVKDVLELGKELKKLEELRSNL